MSSAWTVRGRLHVSCDRCGSEGTTTGTLRRHHSPAARSAAEAQGKLVQDRVRKFLEDARAAQSGKASSQDRARILQDYRSDVEKIVRAAPSLDGVTTVLEGCPWCGAQLNLEVKEIDP